MMLIKRKLNIERITVKKRKGTVETFDKKSDKINHQHYDHCYAKNIIIDCVNDDCLAEIFTYVPTWERPKIALVCKKWKRALDDSWFNVKKIEITYWRYHEYPNCLNNYQTSVEKLNFLQSLFDKCGRYLTVLDLTAYGHCNIVPIINNYCPNLLTLRLRFISVDDVLLFDAFTRLSKLESLTIIFENMESKVIPLTLINSLKNVADTLDELNLLHFVDRYANSCFLPIQFLSVIRELKLMKNLEVAGIVLETPDFIDYILNNETRFYANHNRYFLKPYNVNGELDNIKLLDLTNCHVKDNSLYTIANTFEKLEQLIIPSAWITDNGVVALSKMHNLRNIFFFGPGMITDSSVKLLKNMTKIWLPQSNKITDVSVTELIKNSPKIYSLLLHGTSVTAELLKKAADISNIRKHCLNFSIFPLIPDIKQYESPYFKQFFLEDERKKMEDRLKQCPRE